MRRSADFGYVPYGKILQGELILPNGNDEIGCSYANKNPDIKGKFLVTRIGSCSVLQKAFIAQNSGATLIAIVADHDLIDEIHILNPGMQSDKIRIPVIIITKTVGDKLINAILSQTNHEYLSAKCFFPRDIYSSQSSKVVKIDYWFDPLDTTNYKFFYQFSSLHEELDKRVQFKYHLMFGISREKSSSLEQQQNCVSQGKYCSEDPDGKGFLTGRDAVLIGLAMLCLQQQDQSYVLTNMIKDFDMKCLIQLNGKNNSRLDCLQQVANGHGFKHTDFKNKCFKETFEAGDDYSGNNKLLEQELLLFHTETVQIWPELYVNSRAIRGNIYNLQELESAICAGFNEDESIPVACNEYFDNIDDSLGTGYIIIIILLTGVCIFTILFYLTKIYYHRKLKQKIDGEINHTIDKYIEFTDHDQRPTS